MLETILAISGKPGLYKLVSRGNRSLIVETIDAQKKRFPAFAADKVISLADIAMYTDEKEVPLRIVLNSIKTKESGKTASIDYRKASKDELYAYLGEVLPTFDRDRVYPTDIKKLIQWYNILIENGLDDFDETLKETEGDNIDDRKTE
jgi:dephospho-CoA kinase